MIGSGIIRGRFVVGDQIISTPGTLWVALNVCIAVSLIPLYTLMNRSSFVLIMGIEDNDASDRLKMPVMGE